ncbi:MAG: SDR family oxidoreductase [Terracoccus sp.]
MAAQRIDDLRGRVCLVTGTTSGIGRETARGLAQAGASVLMVARDPARGAEVAAEIRSTSAAGSVEMLTADLACQADVRALAGQVRQGHDRLDVLIHNAAAVNTTRRVTVDGIEATLAVNHLAPFLLTDLLAPLLRATPSSRVVTVSSYLHTRVNNIPWDDLQAEHDYSADATYNLTKLMNVLFTYELARRWAGTSVTAKALHPGWPVKTNLGREQTGSGALFDRARKLIGASAAKGARTSLYLAGSPDIAAVTRQYFSRCRPAKSSALSHNTAAAERLWARSAALCGLPAL